MYLLLFHCKPRPSPSPSPSPTTIIIIIIIMQQQHNASDGQELFTSGLKRMK